MKYYSEEAAKDLRAEFEAKVLGRPQVGTKKMFGCPCYRANGTLFAFLVTHGVVLTRLTQSDKEVLARRLHAVPFRGGRRIVRGWLQCSIETMRDVGRILPFVRKSYQASLGNRSDSSPKSRVPRKRPG
jgi:hypothetical protein